MPAVSFSIDSDMSYHADNSYDYVKRVTEDIGRYKLTDVQETEEYEEDFFGNRLHTLPPRRMRNNSNLPKHDIFKDPDYFNKFLTSQLPKYANYAATKEDILKDFFWSTPRRSHQYASSYKRENDWFKESDSLSSSLFSTSPRRRSSIGSTGTTASMDALWELHPRRLSEAGLSRHSDSSAILTEDTDSFIIGQRVWVGGAKPGQIAYIGETQFAPGEWAGIVLDQPIGKNDGSVGGIRYFQCEPKRGVFSRLTRLTRFPMSEVGSGDSFSCASPSPTNGNRKSPISPSTSTRSAMSISNTSLASTHVDFKVGDRVIIKSSQGSKIGTLRYIGFTSFANGEWCGVELDEPRGKNDGSVEGKRYFECRQNFGLFAPVSKVSKSPSNRRPGGGNCVIHPGGDMRRGASRESLSSLASSVTSATPAARRVRLGVTSLTPKRPSPKSSSTPLPSRTALQDVLNEKQQHIEALLKERDLERAEITRAASQADEAEQKFVNLKQEFEQYRKESEARYKESIATTEKLRTEVNESLAQLDDEKRKNEDLQFKFEEAAITKGDIEVTNDENERRIKNLESDLETARSLIEGDVAKFSETKEELARCREEIENLKVNLEHANAKRISLENEEAKSIDLVQSLQAQLEESGEALKRHQEESTRKTEDLMTDVSKQASELEVATFKYATEIEEARAKYSVDVKAKNDELELLKKDLGETKVNLERVSKDLEKSKFDSAAVEVGLKRDVDKARMELSAKILEIETRDDLMMKKDEHSKKLEVELGELRVKLEEACRQNELVKGSSASNQEVLVKKLEELKERLKVATGELENGKLGALELEKEKNALQENRNVIIKMLEESQLELKKVNVELEDKTSAFEASQTSIKQLEEVLHEKQDDHQKLQIKLDELTSKLSHESSSLEESKVTIGNLELQLGDSQRKLQQNIEKSEELGKQKLKLEAEIQNLYGSSGEDSQKLESMIKEIRDKESEIARIKDESAQIVQNTQHELQQKGIELQNVVAKYEKEIVQLKNEIEAKHVSEIEAKQKFDACIVDRDKVNEDLRTQLVETKQLLLGSEECLKKAIEDVQSKTMLLEQGKLETLKLVELLRENEEVLKKTLEDAQNKTILVEQSGSETQKLAESLKQSEETLKKTLEEVQSKTMHLEETQELVNKSQTIINTLSDEVAQRNEELSKTTQELEVCKTNLQATIAESKSLLENEKKGHEEKLSNVQKELMQKTTEVDSLKKQIAEITSHLSSTKEIALTQKMEVIATLQSELEATNMTMKETLNERELLKQENAQKCIDYETKRREMQLDVDASRNEIQELLRKLDATKNDVNSNLVNVESKELEITKLATDLEKLRESTRILEKEKAEVESSSKKALEESAKNCEELSNRIAKLNENLKDVEKSKSTLDAEKQNYVKIVSALKLTSSQKQELLKCLANSNLQALVSDVKIEEDVETKQQVGELREKLKVTAAALDSARLELQMRQVEVANLEESLAKMKQGTAGVPEGEVEASVVNNNQVSNDYKQLLEEKLFVENQVQFLNSIIVDMQKKNEEQKIRIEILEQGYSPAAADDLKMYGFPDAKKTPPRPYCDICEEFDLHETEGCPQQGADDLPSPPRDKNREKPPPRPYCENCEMFGHSTEDCVEEDQTF